MYEEELRVKVTADTSKFQKEVDRLNSKFEAKLNATIGDYVKYEKEGSSDAAANISGAGEEFRDKISEALLPAFTTVKSLEAIIVMIRDSFKALQVGGVLKLPEEVFNTIVSNINKARKSLLGLGMQLLNIQQASDGASSSLGGRRASGGGSSIWKKVGLAMIGVRSIYFLLRRIFSQNKNLTSAMDNLFTAIGGALKPILDFVAAIINWIANLIAKIFKVNLKTAGNTGSTARSLAHFDEIDNIGGRSGGGSGSSAIPTINEVIKKLNWLRGFILTMISAITLTILYGVGVISSPISAILLTVGFLFAYVLTHLEDIKGYWNSFVEGLKSQWKTWVSFFKTTWQTAKDEWDKFKKGIDKLGNDLLDWWDKNITQPLTKSFTSILNSISKGLSNIWSWIKKIFGDNSLGGTTVNSGGYSLKSGGFASGGFPTTGQMFIAREAGPELVGTIGGHTAVANNSQIIEGIKQGVKEALMECGGTNVYLDGKLITKSVASNIVKMNRITGGALI